MPAEFASQPGNAVHVRRAAEASLPPPADESRCHGAAAHEPQRACKPAAAPVASVFNRPLRTWCAFAVVRQSLKPLANALTDNSRSKPSAPRSVQDIMSARLCKPLPIFIRVPLWCIFLFALVRSTMQHVYLMQACGPFCARQFSATVPLMNMTYSLLHAFLGLVAVTGLLLCKRRHCMRAEKGEHVAIKVLTALAIASSVVMCLAYFGTALPYIFRLQRVARIAQCVGGVSYLPRQATGRFAGAASLVVPVFSDPAALGPAAAQLRLTGVRKGLSDEQRQQISAHKQELSRNASWAPHVLRHVYYHAATTDTEALLLNAASAPPGRLATSRRLRAAASWQREVPGWTGHVCVALVQGTGWPDDVSAAVQETTQRFADMHGYTLIVDQRTSLVTQHGQWPNWNTTFSRSIPTLPDGWAKDRLLSPKMAKIAISHWLLSGEAPLHETGSRRCDMVLTLDRDAIITGPGQGVHKLLSAAPHAVFHAAQDPLLELFPFNSGVLLLARHPWVLQTLQRAWQDQDPQVREGREGKLCCAVLCCAVLCCAVLCCARTALPSFV